MATSETYFTAQQLETIEKLRDVLKNIQAQNIHVAGLHDYEVHNLNDAAGKPYISLT